MDRRSGDNGCGRTLLSCDLWTNEWTEIAAAAPRPDCSTSAASATLPIFAAKAGPHITLCGRNSVQIHERSRPIDLAEMEERLPSPWFRAAQRLLLRFQRGEHNLTLFADGRAIIQGTTDVAVARSLYARFVGS